jgi:hypothetical protein
MKKTLLAFSALAAVTFIASTVTRTEASPLANPSALSGAVDEFALVDKVHCRPGSAHHTPSRSRQADGCLRNSGAMAAVPGPTRSTYPEGVWYNGYYYHYYTPGDYQSKGIAWGD